MSEESEKVMETGKKAAKELAEYKQKLREVFNHIPASDMIKAPNTLKVDKGYTPLIIKPNWNDYHFRYWEYGDTKDFWLVRIETTTQEVKQAFSFWLKKQGSIEVQPSNPTKTNFPKLPIKEMFELTGYRKNWFIVDNDYHELAHKKVEELFRPKEEAEDPKVKKYKEQAKEILTKKPKEETKTSVEENMDEWEKKRVLEDSIVNVATMNKEELEKLDELSEDVIDMENEDKYSRESYEKALTIGKGQSSQYLSLGRSVDDVLASWKEFRDLDSQLLEKSDYQEHYGKKFKKKSAFRKYKTAYVLSDEIVKENTKFLEDGSYYSEFWVKCYPAGNPNYHTIGIGLVHSKEKCKYEVWKKKNKQTGVWEEQQPCEENCNGLKHFDHKLHNIKSTAHTRAKSRAISDLVAGGEVSYEEVA